MIPFMGKTICWVLALFYLRDFAIFNLNSSSNFVIEHFRRTDFHTVLYTVYINELSQNAGTVLDNQVRAIYLN